MKTTLTMVLLMATSACAGVALESGLCPQGVPVRYAVVGGTPADRETIAASLDTWALGTAPGPAEDAAATRETRRPRNRARRVGFVAVNGLRFVPTDDPGAAWIFRVGDAGAGIRTEGSCGTALFGGQVVIHLPAAPASVTVLHEIGHGLGLQHPSRLRAYTPEQQEAVYALFGAAFGYSRDATEAQVFRPFSEPIRTSPDGPSLLEILPPTFGLPSPDGLPTAGDLAFVRALYPPRLESYRIPPPRRRP